MQKYELQYVFKGIRREISMSCQVTYFEEQLNAT